MAADDVEPLSSEDMKVYLSQHKVLQSVHRALNTAVRDRAANPLLHMARTLRAERTAALAAECGRVPMRTGTAPCPPEPRDHLPCLKPPEPLPPSGDLVSASGGRLEPIGGLHSEEQLREVLTSHGVDPSSWVAAGAEGLAELMAELRSGESVLCRTDGGDDATPLRRVVQYTEVEVHLGGRVLVLTYEELGGHARRKFDLPRAKHRTGEAWQGAAERAIGAALHTPAGALLVQEGTHEEERGVEAHGGGYPGLPCEYTRHYAQASLAAPQGSSDGYGTSERFCTTPVEASPAAPAAAGEVGRKHKLHWAWYPLREWETIRRKKEHEAKARLDEQV